MKEQSTLEQIQNILREYKQQPELCITAETRLTDLRLDSLDTIDLVMEIEERLGVTLEVTRELPTVGAIIEMFDDQRRTKRN